MSEPKANPFLHMGQYYWTDADQQIHGPFKDARSALQDLLRTQDPLFFQDRPHDGLFDLVLALAGIVILISWWFGK